MTLATASDGGSRTIDRAVRCTKNGDGDTEGDHR